MIATVSARTGIAPLALRDAAVDDGVLFDEVVRASGTWSPELELAAAGVEVAHETMRVVLQLGGAKRIPPALAIPRSRELRRQKPPRVSFSELAALTGRPIVRADE